MDSNSSLIKDLLALTLENVVREYPNGIRHNLRSDDDVPPVPRELHPSFYGCYDWHSAVHSHWQMIRAIRLFPEGSFVERAVKLLNRHLSPELLAVELAYMEANRSFERPYGLAWLLQICAELREWGSEDALRWLAALEGLETLSAERITTSLPALSHPVRTGAHNQTAFSLGLVWDWAKIAGRDDVHTAIEKAAKRFYGADTNAPLAYEPSGTDFISVALGEADLMRRVLAQDAFVEWLNRFLPADASAWLQPVIVGDATDGQLAHFAGLNISRAWMMQGIAEALPDGDSRIVQLRVSAETHIHEGLKTASDPEYMVSHWVPTFTIYLLTRRGLTHQ